MKLFIELKNNDDQNMCINIHSNKITSFEDINDSKNSTKVQGMVAIIMLLFCKLGQLLIVSEITHDSSYKLSC